MRACRFTLPPSFCIDTGTGKQYTRKSTRLKFMHTCTIGGLWVPYVQCKPASYIARFSMPRIDQARIYFQVLPVFFEKEAEEAHYTRHGCQASISYRCRC